MATMAMREVLRPTQRTQPDALSLLLRTLPADVEVVLRRRNPEPSPAAPAVPLRAVRGGVA
jgi:hypothetical protein